MRRLGPAAWVFAVLFVPPAVLAWWQGWPLPERWLDAGFWGARPLPDGAASSIMATVGWLLWLLMVYAVVIRPTPSLRRVVRGARSMVSVVAVLVGVPIGLVWWAGWPLPSRWPSDYELRVWLAEPLTWPTIVAAAAIVGWLLWLALLYAAIVEATTRLRRIVRWLPALPLPTPLQGLAGGVLGAAAVSGHATSGQAAAPPADVAVVATLPVSSTAAVPTTGVSGIEATARLVGDRDPVDFDAVEGVALPDGSWLPSPVADAVAAAAAFVWSRRRQLYLPRALDEPTRADPDLVPLPSTVRAIQTSRAAATDGSTVERGRVGEWPSVTTGGLVLDRGPWLPDLPAGGVGLTGEGAMAAARAVVGTHMLQRNGGVSIVTTGADLRLLTGSQNNRTPENVPGLYVGEDLPAALGVVEQILLDSSAEQQAQVLLVATSPADVETARRLAVLLTLGHERGVAGVLLGDWSPGATWHVEAHGRIRHGANDVGNQRLGVLTAVGLNDLLTLHRIALGYSDEAPVPPMAERSSAPNREDPTQVGTAEPATVDVAATAKRAPVVISILGAPTVHCGGTPVVIRRSAGMQVLVFLAVQPAGATGPR